MTNGYWDTSSHMVEWSVLRTVAVIARWASFELTRTTPYWGSTSDEKDQTGDQHRATSPGEGRDHVLPPFLSLFSRDSRDRNRTLVSLTPLWGCMACMAAYAKAWDVLDAAGGVTQWLAQFEARAPDACAGRTLPR
jgi:hypothetical protein